MLKKRCVYINSGIVQSINICGFKSCTSGAFYVKLIENPNFGTTNFDNIMYSFLQVFQCITMVIFIYFFKIFLNIYILTFFVGIKMKNYF